MTVSSTKNYESMIRVWLWFGMVAYDKTSDLLVYTVLELEHLFYDPGLRVVFLACQFVWSGSLCPSRGYLFIQLNLYWVATHKNNDQLVVSSTGGL